MRIPCDSCPFRRGEKAVRLTEARATEIAETDGEFPCHKTTVEGDGDDGEGEMESTKTSKICAGFLIFREKQERPNQLMRIAERIGMYDAGALMKDNPALNEVFDDLDEMLEVQWDKKEA